RWVTRVALARGTFLALLGMEARSGGRPGGGGGPAPLEGGTRLRHRVIPAPALEVHSNLGGRARLRDRDRVLHHFEIRLARETVHPPRMTRHHQLPLAPPPPKPPPPPLNPPPPPPPKPPPPPQPPPPIYGPP